MLRHTICLLLAGLTFSSPTTFATEINSPKISHVIYITLDGTRWQDVFLQHKYMPMFWQKYAARGNLYGAPGSNTKIEVSSVPIGLPSYQYQMAGYLQPCENDDCGRIQVETLPENLVHTYGFDKKDVAVFGSWYEISYAAEHLDGTVFTNSGNMPVTDPETQLSDAVMDKINQEQSVDHPLGSDRYDKYTFAQALHYFSVYQPRFMWISLQDTDEAAHAGNKLAYLRGLAFYDQALNRLFTQLKKMQLDKSTLVMVTTDHGRGNGKNWTTHDPKYPESKQIWAFVMNGKLKSISQNNGILYYNTQSIRPTIENALGLT